MILAYELGTILKLEICPDLVCIVGNTDMMEELHLLYLHKDGINTLLVYDTTFEMGDFYVSHLVCITLCISRRPCNVCCQ